MNKVVILDACELSDMCHPSKPEARECQEWAMKLKQKGILVRVPEIAVYELRRAWILQGFNESLKCLDEQIRIHGLLPLCTEAMDQAAVLWAGLRRSVGKSGTDDKLDADVIICAQAFVFAGEVDATAQVATDNIRHFRPLVGLCGGRLIDPQPWRSITP